MYVSTRAALALDRLARHHGVTKRQVIERLLIAEDDRILATLDLGAPMPGMSILVIESGAP